MLPARRALPVALLAAALAGCPTAEPPPADDDDSLPPVDDDDATAGDSALTGSVEVVGGGDGTVIVELLAAAADATPARAELGAGRDFEFEGLAPGPYRMRAWLDLDGDEEHDGVWSSAEEPSALLGVTIPREDLLVRLRAGLPEPELSGDPQWLALWDRAWELASQHVAAGTPANGFAHHYLDEAFSEQIFQWDTCFMTLFGRYGLDSYPVMESLDNFYGVQREDGFICRVVDEDDGEPCTPTDPSDPMLNPQLFAWVELLYARQTGDLSRLPRVLPVLDAYHDWIDGNVRTGPGLYYTSLLGSGMDNAPREQAYDGWVDVTAQQALARRSQATLHRLIGEDALADQQEAEAERICGDVRDLMWDADDGFFYDLGPDGVFLGDRTLASVWPLVAGCATPQQAASVVEHLRDPAEFWRSHTARGPPPPSTGYDPAGHYWRGGVWAPTTYATIVALHGAGRDDLARAATHSHLRNLYGVYADFAPGEDDLAYEAIGDGTATLWELYAPDSMRPGTRWDATWLGRQDFVGWTGLGPIALLLEQVIGLEANALDDTLTWRLTRTDRHGVMGYRFGDQLVDIRALERSGPGDEVTLSVNTSDAFTLVVLIGGEQHTVELDRGADVLTLTPSTGPVPTSVVPSGPFPGYAVLGNGRISAVWSDDDGSADPPGLLHLYLGDFGTDVVETGRTRVSAEGERVTVQRVGLDPFFAAWAEAPLPDGGLVTWRAFVGEADAVVVRGALIGGPEGSAATVAPDLRLRDVMHIDGALGRGALGLDDGSGALWAELTDGRALALGALPSPASWQAGDFAADPAVDALDDSVSDGPRLAMAIPLSAGAGEAASFRWVLATGGDRVEALATLGDRLATTEPLAEAEADWATWSPEAICGDGGPDCAMAAAGIYAARASSLGGQIPADLTGQFVTNGFPQLYPRDALMVARAMELAGHDAEAMEVVGYWLGVDDGPQPGEWWARYDALGRGVDAGTGAAYDVPEWDAAGYMAVLAERLGPSSLSVDQRAALLAGLDLLVTLQDDDGLWTEGGIVEWVGRLPGTAMTSWAGLDAGARLADGWGEPERAASYRAAAGRLRAGLYELVDLERPMLSEERDGGLAYDTSMLFGPAWGYPADPLLDHSLDWSLEQATALGGGVRYFEGLGYGQDLFFFTTSAAAQYAHATGRADDAARLMDWMAAFTNRYGLAPERVYSSGDGAAEASPLSWCAAELGVAVLALRDTTEPPLADGLIDPFEYRGGWGGESASTVDHDGEPDADGSPVALYAAADGSTLAIGLRLASPGARAPAGTVYRFYVAPSDGVGPAQTSEDGHPLPFIAAPDATPGAAARVEVDPADVTCVAGLATVDGFEDGLCDVLTLGDHGFEVRATVDLTGPLQVIAAADLPGGEELLPAGGALRVGGETDRVLATFEVDATAVADQLDPGAGVVVTLSGDREELGGWAGNAVGLVDDGTLGDQVAGDGVWTTTVWLDRGGAASYKFLVGTVGDGSWAGVEFDGDDRRIHLWDLDGDGRVGVSGTFGTPGGLLVEP